MNAPTPDAEVVHGHRPTLARTSLGSGCVGCECMTIREWHGYVTQHGGPWWVAWYDHVTEQAADRLAQAQAPTDAREATPLLPCLRHGGLCDNDEHWGNPVELYLTRLESTNPSQPVRDEIAKIRSEQQDGTP